MTQEWLDSRSKQMAGNAQLLYDYYFHSASHLAWAQQRAYGWTAEFSLAVAVRIKINGDRPRVAFHHVLENVDGQFNGSPDDLVGVFDPFVPVPESVGDAASLDLQLEAAYDDEQAAEHLLTFGAQAIDVHTAASLRVMLIATRISVSRKMFNYEYTHEMVW
jgi:hypothetical protein